MRILIAALLFLLPTLGRGQGQFWYSNLAAPTRIGSTDGPWAGAGTWGQMLLGETPESLIPLGTPREHANGRISAGVFSVPGIAAETQVYVQMVAWNGIAWGTSLAAVPSAQLGRSDIVPIVLTYDFQTAFAPAFSQPALVPVPEPATWALGAIGAVVVLVGRSARRRLRGESRLKSPLPPFHLLTPARFL